MAENPERATEPAVRVDGEETTVIDQPSGAQQDGEAQAEESDYNPDQLIIDLLAEGKLQQPHLEIAAKRTVLIQQMLKAAFSMTLSEAEDLLRHHELLLKEARKRNDPGVPNYASGAKAMRMYLKFRRDLERLKPRD